MLKQINPEGIMDGRTTFGMSQGIVDTVSGLAFFSGQVSWDVQGNVVGQTVAEQIEVALKNVGIMLQSVGAQPSDVVRLRVYVRGEAADHVEALAGPIAAFFKGHYPALTGIGVASLATPDTLVELEVVTRVPGNIEPA